MRAVTRSSIVIISSLFVFFLACFAAEGQDDESVIKENFVKAIKTQIKSINEKEEVSKDKPEPLVQYSSSDKVWRICYYRFQDDFKYDVTKSESAGSPYTGVAEIEVTIYKRVGATREECLAAQTPSKFESLAKVKYAYQAGKWVPVEGLESLVERWRTMGEDLGCGASY